MRPIVLCTAVLATSAVLAGCGSGRVDKSGAATHQSVTLTIAIPENSDPLAAAFRRAVRRESGGSIRLTGSRQAYPSADPSNEVALARDVQRGRVDIGYLPARAWAAAGTGTFRTLLAPFVITTDAAAQRLATSAVAQDLLGSLPKTVVGLGLVPGETRRVLAARATLEPRDYAGLRLRIIDNAQTAAAFSALGSKPVEGLRSYEVVTALRDRRIDGAETAPSAIVANGYQSYVRALSGYGVFPSFASIVVARRAWDRLSTAQRNALRAAARDTVASAAGEVAAQERSDLRQLCAANIKIAVPTQEQLSALATAASPAIERLRADNTTAALLDGMLALPGAGPQPQAAPVASGCATSTRMPAGTSRATIPNGSYVVKIKATEFHSVGAVGPDFAKDVTFTSTFKNGHFVNTQRPTYPDQCADKPSASHAACVGTYEIDGDQLTFKWSPPTPPPVPAPETVKWSYFGGQLHLEPVNVADAVSRLIYSHPWRKVR